MANPPALSGSEYFAKWAAKQDATRDRAITKTAEVDAAAASKREKFVPTITNAEALNDLAVNFTAGTARVGQAGYTIADMLSRYNSVTGVAATANFLQGEGFQADAVPSLDELVGLQRHIDPYVETIKEQLSAPSQHAAEQVAKAEQEYAAGADQRFQEHAESLGEEGPDFLTFLESGAAEIYGSAAAAFKAYIKDPLAAVNVAQESIPQLLAGGATAKGATALGTKRVAQRATNQGLEGAARAEFIKEGVDEIGRRAAAANIVAQEAGTNAGAIQGEVLNTSHETLYMRSEDYRAQVDSGVDPEEARRNLANNAADITFGTTAPVALFASKVTGADKVTSSIFGQLGTKAALADAGADNIRRAAVRNLVNKGAPVLGGAARITGGATREGFEEVIQSGGGEALSNAALRATADNTRSITEGVGSAAVSGAFAGALSGGAVSTPAALAETAAGILQDPSTSFADLDRNQKVAAVFNAEDTAVAAATALDPTQESYDPHVALDVLLHEQTLTQIQEGTSEQKADHLSRVGLHISELATALQQEATNGEERTDTEQQGLIKRIEHVQAQQQELQRQQELLTKPKKDIEEVRDAEGEIVQQAELGLDTIIEEVGQATERTPEIAEKVEDIILPMAISRDKVDYKALEKIVDSPAFNDEQRTRAQNFITTEKSLDALRKAGPNKSQGQVNVDIIEGTEATEGNPGFRGIKTYLATISSAARAANFEVLSSNLESLATFRNRHTQKAAALQEAISFATELGRSSELLQDEQSPTGPLATFTEAQVAQIQERLTPIGLEFQNEEGKGIRKLSSILDGTPAYDIKTGSYRKDNGIRQEVQALTNALTEAEHIADTAIPGTSQAVQQTVPPVEVDTPSPVTDTPVAPTAEPSAPVDERAAEVPLDIYEQDAGRPDEEVDVAPAPPTEQPSTPEIQQATDKVTKATEQVRQAEELAATLADIGAEEVIAAANAEVEAAKTNLATAEQELTQLTAPPPTEDPGSTQTEPQARDSVRTGAEGLPNDTTTTGNTTTPDGATSGDINASTDPNVVPADGSSNPDTDPLQNNREPSGQNTETARGPDTGATDVTTDTGETESPATETADASADLDNQPADENVPSTEGTPSPEAATEEAGQETDIPGVRVIGEHDSSRSVSPNLVLAPGGNVYSNDQAGLDAASERAQQEQSTLTAEEAQEQQYVVVNNGEGYAVALTYDGVPFTKDPDESVPGVDELFDEWDAIKKKGEDLLSLLRCMRG